MEQPDSTALADAELEELVARLRDEEQHLSRRRETLHRRIDFLQGGGYAHLDASVEQLATLQEAERAVSAERHALHGQIEAALGELHLRRAHRLTGA